MDTANKMKWKNYIISNLIIIMNTKTEKNPLNSKTSLADPGGRYF